MRKAGILLIGMLIMVSMTSCQKSWEKIRKNTQTTNRNYVIDQYSGGVLIGHYEFRGMLNDSDGSDGYYYYDGKTLVEISGDLVIRSTK